MIKTGINFRKEDFIHGGIITGIIGVIACVVSAIGLSTDVFDPLGQALDNFHISDGFFYSRSIRNSSHPELNPGIVLVDIKDADSREEIADIVNRINEASPRLLAVDIIFGKTASVASESDEALVSAFRGSKNLILAQRVVDGFDRHIVERSFFADDVECEEGEVSFANGIVRTFSQYTSVRGTDYPSFIGQIAGIGGIDTDFGEQLINYSPIKNISVGPEDLPANDLLKDQIVILGDSRDLRDFHDIPIIVDGQARTSGLNIIAQSIYTLQSNNRFTCCPDWLALIIGILLTYLFCTFIISPMYRIDKFNGLWISIWQVIILLCLLFITYLLFWNFHFNMTLTYWLIGVGLSGFATELFYFVKNKK